MTTKQVLRIVGFILNVVFAGLCNGGTADYQAYPGPALPRNQVAVICFDRTRAFPGAFAMLTDVDNRHLTRGSRSGWVPFRDKAEIPRYIDSFELLPGHHTIQLEVNVLSRDKFISRSVTKSIDVGAGKTYSLTAGYSFGPVLEHKDAVIRIHQNLRGASWTEVISPAYTTYDGLTTFIDYWECPGHPSAMATWPLPHPSTPRDSTYWPGPVRRLLPP